MNVVEGVVNINFILRLLGKCLPHGCVFSLVDGKLVVRATVEDEGVGYAQEQLGRICDEVNISPAEETQEVVADGIDTRNNIPLTQLGLSVRALNVLEKWGFANVGDLRKTTAKELRDIKNIGPKIVEEVRQALADLGIVLRSE